MRDFALEDNGGDRMVSVGHGNLEHSDGDQLDLDGQEDNLDVYYGDGSRATPAKWWAPLGGYGVSAPKWPGKHPVCRLPDPMRRQQTPPPAHDE